MGLWVNMSKHAQGQLITRWAILTVDIVYLSNLLTSEPSLLLRILQSTKASFYKFTKSGVWFNMWQSGLFTHDWPLGLESWLQSLSSDLWLDSRLGPCDLWLDPRLNNSDSGESWSSHCRVTLIPKTSSQPVTQVSRGRVTVESHSYQRPAVSQ